MVKEINDELMDLGMEPKPESLWWTSTYKDVEEQTSQVDGRGKNWEMPFIEEFNLL